MARTEIERNAAALPADASVLGNNPHITFSNQAYKGYAILTAGRDLTVRHRAVREHTSPGDKRVFDLRKFRVEDNRPVVIDEGGPNALPEPRPGPLPVLPTAPFQTGTAAEWSARAGRLRQEPDLIPM